MEAEKPAGALKPVLPEGVTALIGQPEEGAGLDAWALVREHVALLKESRAKARRQFREMLERTAGRLREILQLDEAHAPEAVTPGGLAAALGSWGSGLLDSEQLAGALRRPVNPLKRMEPARRARCEQALAYIEDGLMTFLREPDFRLFYSGAVVGAKGSDHHVPNGAVSVAKDCFASALQSCEASLMALTRLLRAVHVARLEIESAYDPAVHDEVLARFDWEAAEEDEIRALTPVLALESAERATSVPLSSFDRVLRSGLPVHVLIVQESLSEKSPQDVTPDFGFLAVTHREGFVLQSSMAEPQHRLPGLKKMADSLRPAVAVISTAAESAEGWNSERLLVLSRALPLFEYDPEGGEGWAGRLRLLVPSDEAASLNAAQAAAASGRMAEQFRVIPQSEWTPEQMEISEYLAGWTARPPLAIPYLWVLDESGERKRALITRELARLCLDRKRAWELLSELCTVKAATPAVNEAAREEGARQAIERVIALLAE
jgi:hypothetical protein